MSASAEQVRAVVSDSLCVRIAQVTPESRLVADLGADSMDMLQLLLRLETEFEIELDDEALESMKTVADVARVIDEKFGR
jgi:acyl carrier protein